jgi:hypothetical protein
VHHGKRALKKVQAKLVNISHSAVKIYIELKTDREDEGNVFGLRKHKPFKSLFAYQTEHKEKNSKIILKMVHSPSTEVASCI